MIGTILSGRYQLAEIVGKGGMATVYKATDLKLQRTIAVKVIHPDTAADPNFAKHFQTEAQNAATLNHPNILAVYDVGEDQNFEYIVLEFVEGKTLKEVLNDGPLSIDLAVKYARQLASGLDAAHQQGILHCDIKPQNVLITKDKIAKLADFGISRAVASTGGMTGGMILGTLDYLAPEQIEGKRPDQRSDIYALGLVIYEMLSGELPFGHPETPAQALAQRIAIEPKPLREVKPGIPEDVEAGVMKALHRDPDARYQTADALAGALAHIDESHSALTIAVKLPLTHGQRPRWHRRRGLLPTAAGVLLISALAIVLAASALRPPSVQGVSTAGGNTGSPGIGGVIGQLGAVLVEAVFPPRPTPTPTGAPIVAPKPTPVPAATPTPAPMLTPTPTRITPPARQPGKQKFPQKKG
ncbi:MAG: protein kinase [Dehalococcoidia bacterium]|nr:protein kinase [Dehalococcoidia bacterium]